MQQQRKGHECDGETNRAVDFLRPTLVDAVACAVTAVDVVPSVRSHVQRRVTPRVQRRPPRTTTSGPLVFRCLPLQVLENVRSPANA